MKAIVFFIVTSAILAESSVEYRARKVFEAGDASDATNQTSAIRECAVSHIDRCVHPILEQLKKEGPEHIQLRRESINALGHLRAIEAREPVLGLLAKESDLKIKIACLRALGRIGNKADIKVISGYLSAPEPLLRRQASQALFEMYEKEAASQVSKQLITSEKDDLTRAELLRTATQYDNNRVDYAFELVKILHSADAIARLRAAEVMVNCRNKETLSDLERAYATETDSRVRAVLHTAINVTYHDYVP